MHAQVVGKLCTLAVEEEEETNHGDSAVRRWSFADLGAWQVGGVSLTKFRCAALGPTQETLEVDPELSSYRLTLGLS